MREIQHNRPSGFHPVNIGHLVMGLALLGLVGVWALWQSEVVGDSDVRWLLPIPWVVAGGAGLVATAIAGPRRHAVRQAGLAGERPEHVASASSGPFPTPDDHERDAHESKEIS